VSLRGSASQIASLLTTAMAQMTPEKEGSASPPVEVKALNRTYDWPLSKVEKKDVLMKVTNAQIADCNAQLHRLQRLHIDDSSKKCLNTGRASLPASEPDSEPMQSACKSESGEVCWSPVHPRRLSVESGGSTSVNSNKSWSDEDVKETLQAFKAEMARQQQKQQEAAAEMARQQLEAIKKQQQQLEATIEAMKKAQAQAQAPGGNFQEDSDTESQGARAHRRRLHRSCPERTDGMTPPSALKGKRRSRGGSLPRVRFAEHDLGTSSDEDVIQSTASAECRGRVRRVSRGPDGQAYNVSDKVEQPLPNEQESANANSSSTRAAAGSVAGGVVGLASGVIGGAVVALPAALFTFGLSIPIGAAFGGGLGCAAGASAGYKLSSSSSQATLTPMDEAHDSTEK